MSNRNPLDRRRYGACDREQCLTINVPAICGIITNGDTMKNTIAFIGVHLEERAKRFVVHFDVDVIDFTDFPIANVPQFSPGLMFLEVMACLAVFASRANFSGLTIIEFNPDHARYPNEVFGIQ